MSLNEDMIGRVAGIVQDDFDSFRDAFKKLTVEAETVFSSQDWSRGQQLTVERLGLYSSHVQRTEKTLRSILHSNIQDRVLWKMLKPRFAELIAARRDGPIVESYFNSVVRRLFIKEGLNADLAFIDFERRVLNTNPEEPIYERFYIGSDDLETIWTRILRSYGFMFKFADLERDVEGIAKAIRKKVKDRFGGLEDVDQMDMVRPVFYRNKGAYLLGKITKGNIQIPIVLPLVHHNNGVRVDGHLLEKNEISIVFSFSRSYFFVDCDNPVDLIQFLRPLMKQKNLSELYASIGYNRHSKTVLVKELYHHLEYTDDRFVLAPGIKGMVMVVFTMPRFNVVFKVIRDRFGPAKNFGRQHVIDCYRTVLLHDRVGRLADAMEYEHLEFDRSRFTEQAVNELLAECAGAVWTEGNKVVIRHLFTERKLIPLNLYLEMVDDEKAHHAIIDYGNAIKEMAAANIFPGDLLLKNFGVTRHGRVIFYDYDELCFLHEVNFRKIPLPRYPEQEYSGEPWYTTGENDVFPEEFNAFMVPAGHLKDAFMKHHANLLDVRFWKEMQAINSQGRITDFFPYRRDASRTGFSIN